ncbi:DUF2059 domain-containing protein [Glacieibacterium frigidum]|uniref:DUF2059 domain-containing protein n=1 Tax=Glacieibacterium frigidum TaxID=2593303 RepID=A0A552U8H1_9SPHN|nr:DUF2059 domain-containing protein [Glacieibacterium frigidum]TRW14516.1 DUF2059 domain-containing protein [Glacieibacterium frigidum]
MLRTLVLTALLLAAPAFAQAPADPARLAAATRIAAKLLPDGSYREMMRGSMDQIMNSITDQMMSMPLKDLVGMAGVDQAKLPAMGPGTIRQLMAILDPAFEQRNKIMSTVMMGEMTEIMTAMEPDMRAGMAEAYARRFDAAQLGEIERFFQGPTGAAFAAQSMQVYTDPAVMTRMQAMMPKLMQAMPTIMKKVATATAGLPAPRKPADLSKAEKAKLEALIVAGPTV